MSRLHFEFGCGSLKLAGALDTAPGETGLLIVSGGNEIRSGAFSGQSSLAARIARAGFPVFRFDRRGVGDSEGENRGFRSSAGDIQAALEAFRAMAPQMLRVFAFGNCDAASALMLTSGEGFDGLILSNPWTLEEPEPISANGETQHAPQALRARYAAKLKDPRELARLARGGVDLRKLMRGIATSLKPKAAPGTLATEMRAGLDTFKGPARILIATEDRTAQLFEACWDRKDRRIRRCEGAGHAYDRLQDQQWLDSQLLESLRS